MKRIKLFLIAVIITVLSSCVSIPDNYNEVSGTPFYVEYNEFKDISFYQHKEMFYSRPSKIYIGKDNAGKWLRIKFKFNGNDWIFFKTATFINSNKERVEFTPIATDRNTYISNNKVYVSEYADVRLSDEKGKALLNLLNGEKIRLRLSGDRYYHDYDISDDEDYLQGLKETLEFYFTE